MSGPSVITFTLTAIVALLFAARRGAVRRAATSGGSGRRPPRILQIDMASSAPPNAALLEAPAHAGARRYGAERVSELAPALQCAELAEASGADEELTLACLLHDVGRVAVDQALVFDRVGGANPAPAATTIWAPSSSRPACRSGWDGSCACMLIFLMIRRPP